MSLHFVVNHCNNVEQGQIWSVQSITLLLLCEWKKNIALKNSDSYKLWSFAKKNFPCVSK